VSWGIIYYKFNSCFSWLWVFWWPSCWWERPKENYFCFLVSIRTNSSRTLGQ